MLYRFDSAASLGAWEASDQRAWWLGSAQGLVGESLRERRTGIEGWFDEPRRARRRGPPAAAAAPPRWKQAVMIWTAFFPLSLLAGLLLGRARAGAVDRAAGAGDHGRDDADHDLPRAPAADPPAGLVAARATGPLAA